MSYESISGPELVIQHSGQVFPLGTEPVTIGTQQDNLIVLADPQGSAHHASISWQAGTGTYVVEDLGSTGGTFVNEVRVRGPQTLRHGDVIRIGNTVMDLRLQPSPEAGFGPPPPLQGSFEEPAEPSGSPVWAGILVALLAGITIVCAILFAIFVLTGGKGTPDVIIQSPTAGAQIAAGSEIVLRATASGAKDIVLLELSVDGALAATSSNPNGISSLTVSKSWIFATPGEHVISAQAYTASDKTSKPSSVEVTVVAGEITTTETPSPTPTAATDTPTPTPTPTATPEDTATPVPTTIPPPRIEFFQASPASVNAGACTKLQWSKVSNATEARIDPDIGSVATPGSEVICPLETTTYVLTANGPGGTSQASATVVVIGGLADLTVDSILFEPNPPVAGQVNEVRITVRNAGIGAANAFDWDWRAGSDASFEGRIYGLNAGEQIVVTVLWNPQAPYDSLTTKAEVDTKGEVVESDKTNNKLTALVQVVEGVSEPQTVVLKSEGTLDGYRLNDGSGSNTEDILVGNGELVDPVGELVARGFMSFDLSGIPAGATVESVELRFYQKKIQGDPYGKLGNLMLEHVYYGGSLSDSAYNTPALSSAMLATQTSPATWYTLSDPTLASWVQSNLEAGRSRFQLRLQFAQETDGDGQEDWIAVAPGAGALGSRTSPQLTITYLP